MKTVHFFDFQVQLSVTYFCTLKSCHIHVSGNFDLVFTTTAADDDPTGAGGGAGGGGGPATPPRTAPPPGAPGKPNIRTSDIRTKELRFA